MQIAINHIAAACAAADIRNAIICPGSRNAPLTMAFARHPDIQCHSVVDERSAGFIALGMSQVGETPTSLICTSGSAVVNFYPAVVEAFYQRIPLLVITADRPPEMIDQWDGQTMHQSDVFGKHVKASYTMPDDYSLPEVFSQTTLQAYEDSMKGIKGPVHINVPLREPLYKAKSEAFIYPELGIGYSNIFYDVEDSLKSDINKLQEAINNNSKVLAVVGHQYSGYFDSMRACQEAEGRIPFLCDILSNQLLGCKSLHHFDILLSIPESDLKEKLQPDVLITFGKSVISKNLKLFLRKYKPKVHFHISHYGETADPFNTSPIQIKGNKIFESLDLSNLDTKYSLAWQKYDDKIAEVTNNFLAQKAFSELTVVDKILKVLPEKSGLQLANSMAVRWVNILGLKKHLFRGIFGNRGVSGIDGCTSTAVGMAFMDNEVMNNWGGEKQGANFITLITGDVAFFYDSNALWNKFAPRNLRIIILNNGGGGIFRLIEGPQQMPELGEFLETQHQRNAALLAKDMNVEYEAASNYEELNTALESFYNPSNKPKILEVFTETEINTQIFNEYKQLIHGLE